MTAVQEEPARDLRGEPADGAPRPTPEDPTLDLLRSAVAGDQDAWRKLYVEHESLMRWILRDRIPADMRRRFDTDDLMQSAFITLTEKGKALDVADAKSFRGWLERVLINKLFDRMRATARPERKGVFEMRAPTELVEQHPDGGVPLDHHAQKAELLARMCERIVVLPADDREIVLLRLVEQRTWAEIAQQTGLGASTVTRRYNQLLESIVRGFF